MTEQGSRAAVVNPRLGNAVGGELLRSEGPLAGSGKTDFGVCASRRSWKTFVVQENAVRVPDDSPFAYHVVDRFVPAGGWLKGASSRGL